MKKICTLCNETKPILEFYSDCKRKDGLESWCKECCRESARKHYRKNPEPYKKRASERSKLTSGYFVGLANKIKKERGCLFCKDHTLCILDFHHLIKGIPVSRAACNSWKSFQSEINKCIVVCANCHRKIHGGLISTNLSMIDPVAIDKFPRKLNVDRKTPARNRATNHVLTFDGQSKTIAEWSEEIGVKPSSIFMRLHCGWSVEKTLTTPARVYRKNPNNQT